MAWISPGTPILEAMGAAAGLEEEFDTDGYVDFRHLMSTIETTIQNCKTLTSNLKEVAKLLSFVQSTQKLFAIIQQDEKNALVS